MKRLALALIILSVPALAQQADPKIETYKFLLNEANERVVQANASISQLQQENAKLKEQIEKRKKEDDEAAKAVPKK